MAAKGEITPPVAAPAKKNDESPRKTAPYTVVRIAPQPPAEAGERSPGPTADARANRLHRTLLATLTTSDVTLTFPRGDLRATSEIEPSRWSAQLMVP